MNQFMGIYTFYKKSGKIETIRERDVMKKYFLCAILLTSLFILISCSTCKKEYFACRDLLTECWQQRINTDPSLWTRNADRWFLYGRPNQAEIAAAKAPPAAAITIMKVRVGDFDEIYING